MADEKATEKKNQDAGNEQEVNDKDLDTASGGVPPLQDGTSNT